MLSFEVRKAGGESEVRKVHRDVIHIGASSGNDLVVRARGVLGRHARISVSGDELRLDVLGTSPGSDVTLNGSVVRSASLAAGDRISIGEATITLLNGPAPNPNRIAAPPPRGRDALSVATAALGGGNHTAVAPAPSPAAPPRSPVPPPEAAPRRAEEERLPAAARSTELWNGVFARLSHGGSYEETLQEMASFLSSGSPLHSIAFMSLEEPGAGEALAALWKGTLPRLSPRTLADLKQRGGPSDVFEGGTRVRLFPVIPPGGEAVAAVVVPLETVSDPVWGDFVAHLAATLGFVHAYRSEPTFGERGGLSAQAPVAASVDDPLSLLVGQSLAMQNLKASLSRVAAARAPVLLVGDVGTGKTLAAETLHALSPRRSRPLIRIAATAATAQALEEDLLGGLAASERRKRGGRLFEAEGGTLLIEEVGDLPAPTQALFFRLLEAREVTAPGGRTVPVDVRVIGTSSRPLTRAVEDGHFRDDLYFRLSALTLRLPPLKERKEDLPALLDAFATRHGGPPADRFDVEAMNALLGYGYPGNVRELENEVRRLAALVASGTVKLADLDQKFSGEHVELALKESDDLKEIVEKVERQVIERVMRKVRGNQSLGARLLNISRGSLIAKMKQYDVKDFRYLKRHE
ncbi:MAG TPA: sigma 54-interacting transcriptional regulator [Thermoanaerobaculia bacterium]|nr:sigma 54-interacting transcriptional regulator [Thermoanaerobaculia bacterium]